MAERETCAFCSHEARVAAQYRFTLDGLPPLELCGHHRNQHADALRRGGWFAYRLVVVPA